MTLRYEGNRPVGLDWPSITTGYDPEVWQKASLAQRQRTKASEPSEGPSPSGKRLLPATERRIVALYRDQEMSALETARATGVQPATVFKVLKRCGVPSRTKAEGMKISRAKRSTAETVEPSEEFL